MCNPVITPSIHPESPYPFLLDGYNDSSYSQFVLLAAPLLDDASSFSVQFLLLELYNGTQKDSGGKEDLEEHYDDENGSTLVHFIVKAIMQVEFAELRVPILSPANDFLMRKSLIPNLQICLQECSYSDRWERF